MGESVVEVGGEGTAECMEEGQSKSEGLKENISRKEKRKALKKLKRKQVRKNVALKEREEEEAMLNDPEEQRRIQLMEFEENERMERERKLFEERERAWLEAMESKKKKMEEEEEEEEEERRRILEEESMKQQAENNTGFGSDDEWEYVEDGPAEIIWQGNEIIVKKKRVRVPKNGMDQCGRREEADRPTSNPLPPQSEAFTDYKNASLLTQRAIENVAQQVPNFGTEQDKAHCPFHLKTGACRFGQRCSRVHFYPDKSSTLLMKNMYNGPGLTWEQDEGLEHTDEEIERCYEEFYEDVHTEFLKFGEIVNFKVCKNGSFHLRGNVYVQYRSLDSAVLAYHSINGRFFAGKQVNCEFVNVTRWKVAICGEYMKLRYKTCSHGTACNFIHCFRNPGGDYEWADSDKPPPRYWIKKMAALFGYDESAYEKSMERDNLDELRRDFSSDAERYRKRRSTSRYLDYSKDVVSGRRDNREYELQKSWRRERHRSNEKPAVNSVDGETRGENIRLEHNSQRYHRIIDSDFNGEQLDRDSEKRRDRHRSHIRENSRKRHRGMSVGADSDGNRSDGDTDSDRKWSDRITERTRDRHQSRSPKSPRKRDRNMNGRAEEAGSDTERSDGGGRREGSCHGHARRSSEEGRKLSLLDNRGEIYRSCSRRSSRHGREGGSPVGRDFTRNRSWENDTKQTDWDRQDGHDSRRRKTSIYISGEDIDSKDRWNPQSCSEEFEKSSESSAGLDSHKAHSRGKNRPSSGDSGTCPNEVENDCEDGRIVSSDHRKSNRSSSGSRGHSSGHAKPQNHSSDKIDREKWT